jgi:hypothetical protein
MRFGTSGFAALAGAAPLTGCAGAAVAEGLPLVVVQQLVVSKRATTSESGMRDSRGKPARTSVSISLRKKLISCDDSAMGSAASPMPVRPRKDPVAGRAPEQLAPDSIIIKSVIFPASFAEHENPT